MASHTIPTHASLLALSLRQRAQTSHSAFIPACTPAMIACYLNNDPHGKEHAAG